MMMAMKECHESKEPRRFFRNETQIKSICHLIRLSKTQNPKDDTCLVSFRHTHSFWMFAAGEAVSVIRASGMTADRATPDMFFVFASKHRGALET